MPKRHHLLVLAALLILSLAGCGPAIIQVAVGSFPNPTAFYLKDGKESQCNQSTNDPCLQAKTYYLRSGNDIYQCTGHDETNAQGCTEINNPKLCSLNDVVYLYDHIVDKGQSWKVVSRQQDQNGSKLPLQITFTSTESQTISTTDEVGVTTNLELAAKFITASVQVHINHSVTNSVTAAIGNQNAFTIPPGKTAFANYGVRVQITTGHLHSNNVCPPGAISDWGTITTYVPIAAGWCVWVTGDTPCPSI